jgi:hypothetical protein
MRTDGSISCFIIKHVHPSRLERGWDGKKWDNSGDCDQFENRGQNRKTFDPFRASGQLWQDYGIHGSYEISDAILAISEMQRFYPEYLWAVFKLEVSQKHTLMMRTENPEPAKAKKK